MPEPSSADASRQETYSVTAQERRSFDRLVNFTDAVVAIGITLQLLPLIDVPGPKAGETVWEVMAANSGQVMAFVLSFVVVIGLWATHNRIFNVMQRSNGRIFALNVAWLMAIVFLPWPTSMYGNAVNDQVVGPGGVGLLYWWNLAAISGLVTLISVQATRNPSLLDPDAWERLKAQQPARPVVGVTVFAVLLGIGVISEFAPSVAPYLALLLIPITALLRRRRTGAVKEGQ